MRSQARLKCAPGASSLEDASELTSLRKIFLGPRRFTLWSVLGLILILAIEGSAVDQLAGTLPSTIPVDSSRPVLQSLIAFNGVLLGFGAIVFGRLLDRATKFRDLSDTLVWMTATVALYIIAVMNSLYGLAISASGLGPEEITGPIGFTIFATTVLFFAVYIQMVRPYLAPKHAT